MSETNIASSTMASMTSTLIASATASATGVPKTVHEKPPVYKTLGIVLALLSGVFIGVSFVMKKKGLLAANLKDGKAAGEGYGYLKNFWWWGGMTLMILGEICNFAAYLFVEAILVTPLGALSVVVTAILSSIFLKERLSFVGKIGCIECIVGSTIIVLNAPKQAHVTTIEDMQDFVIAPGFLAYTGTVIVACACIIFFAAPRWGNTSMLVYISVCSLIGGLSVACIQGIGAAIISQANGIPQFNQWFTYFIIVFVIITLLVEIIYLNKALNIFNAAIVTPTYYVFFTSATIITSAIMFRGFNGSPAAIATVCMGFLQICAGVVLLQLSKSAKNVPDAEVFRGDLDQVRKVAEQEEPEYEPKADAIRGTAAIIRRISVARQEKEAAEAHRIFDERIKDLQNQHLQVPGYESVEWDGVRRRVTWNGGPDGQPRRRNTVSTPHPPLGLTRIPDIEEAANEEEATRVKTQNTGNRRRSMSLDAGMAPHGVYRGFQEADLNPAEPHSIWQKTKGLFVPKTRSIRSSTIGSVQSGTSATHGGTTTTEKGQPMTDIQRPQNTVRARAGSLTGMPSGYYADNSLSPNYTIHRDWAYLSSGSAYAGTDASSSQPMMPPVMPAAKDCSSSTKSGRSGRSGLRVSREPGRQFSFQNIFHKSHRRDESGDTTYSSSKKPLPKSPHADGFSAIATSSHAKTEEEMLGLVTGDKADRSGAPDTPSEEDSDTDVQGDEIRAVRTGATISSNDGDDEKSTWNPSSSGNAGTSNSGRSTIRML